jgi:hypothetical protein
LLVRIQPWTPTAGGAGEEVLLRDHQPRLRLLEEQDLDRNPDIEVEPPRLTDTIERQAGAYKLALTPRGYTIAVVAACVVLVGLATMQWATGLTDDVRASRDSSASMIEKCRGWR